MRITYDKLVRDGIPAIIAADGGQACTRVLDQGSYRTALHDKLLEEAREAREASGPQLMSELADLLEVVRGLAGAYGIEWESIEAEAARKRADRGGFDQRIFLEYVD